MTSALASHALVAVAACTPQYSVMLVLLLAALAPRGFRVQVMICCIFGPWGREAWETWVAERNPHAGSLYCAAGIRPEHVRGFSVLVTRSHGRSRDLTGI